MASTTNKQRPQLVSRDDAAPKTARPATISFDLTAPGRYNDGTQGEGWAWSISAAPYRKDASGNRTIPADPGGLYKISLPLGHGARLLTIAQEIMTREATMNLTAVDGRVIAPGESLGRKCPAGHKVSGPDKFCPQCGARLDDAPAPSSASASNGASADTLPDDTLAFLSDRDVI